MRKMPDIDLWPSPTPPCTHTHSTKLLENGLSSSGPQELSVALPPLLVHMLSALLSDRTKLSEASCHTLFIYLSFLDGSWNFPLQCKKSSVQSGLCRVLLPEGPVTGSADLEPNAEGSCRWCCGEQMCGGYLLLIIDAQVLPNHGTPGWESRPQPSPMWDCVQVP